MMDVIYLNIAQAFLQVGNHFRELRPVLKLKNIIYYWFSAEQSDASGQTRGFSQTLSPAHFSPPTHEAKVNSASKAVLRSPASL